MPSPTVKYHETTTQQNHHNIMQHRSNYDKICHQQSNRYEYDEIEEKSKQSQYQYYNPAQIQHSSTKETQQQADQHTIELRMNNLGNENMS